MRFGVIDVGTNAARLLVGEYKNETSSKIYYTRIPLRLGDDVYSTGFVSNHKITDFLRTIQAFELICKSFQVSKIKAVATSAMRDAKNATEIIKLIQEKTGVDLEVISGATEANFILEAFTTLEFDKTLPFLVIDVGGGSTEISVFENGQRTAAKSFELGTIRLLKQKESNDIWDDLSQWIEANVPSNEQIKTFGTGGNIGKAHKILDLKSSAPATISALQVLHEKLRFLTMEERMIQFPLKSDRADVIVPALEIYLFIMKRINCTEIFVPKIGLADGIIHSLETNLSNL
jgi:exopolyphosphatase/guanosine-5'-triphosphate,3'-diphosphate pyrophosphatase